MSIEFSVYLYPVRLHHSWWKFITPSTKEHGMKMKMKMTTGAILGAPPGSVVRRLTTS